MIWVFLSMSVIGFQKIKVWMGVGVGGVNSIQVFLGFLDFFNFAQPLRISNRFDNFFPGSRGQLPS